MFLGAEVRLDVGFGVAQARLAYLARDGSLWRASHEAYGELAAGLAQVGLLGAAQDLSRLVAVRFIDVAVHEELAVGAIRWETIGSSGTPFPALDADIKLTSAGHDAAMLEVSGVYRPLGGLSAKQAQVVPHRVAQAMIRAFTNHIATAIMHPAISPEAEHTGIPPERPAWPEPETPLSILDNRVRRRACVLLAAAWLAAERGPRAPNLLSAERPWPPGLPRYRPQPTVFPCLFRPGRLACEDPIQQPAPAWRSRRR